MNQSKQNLSRRNFLAAAGASIVGGTLPANLVQGAESPATGGVAPCCATAPKLVFPCSGSSDVGALADQAARQMTLDGTGKMYCLAGIGGRIPSFIESTRAATKVLVIDGCPEECGRKTLEQAGLKNFVHLKLAEMNCVKGATKVTPERIREVAARGAQMVAG